MSIRTTAARLLVRLDDHVPALEVDPTGTALAVGSLSGQAMVVEVAAGQATELPRHGLGTLSVSWSRHGTLATGGQDGAVRLWSPTAGPLGQVSGRGWCSQVTWSPDGDTLGAAVGTSVALVDADATGGQWHHDLASTVTAVVWSPDGRRLGAGCYGGVSWFERSVPEPVKQFPWKGSILSLAMHPGGKWLASGNQDASLHVWRLWSAQDLHMSGYEAKLALVAWDRSGEHLAVADQGEVTSWSFRGKGPAGTRPALIAGHDGSVTALAFRPSGSPLLATGDRGGTLRLWSKLAQHRPDHQVELGAEVSALAWSPDGSFVAVGGADGSVWTVEIP